MKKIICVFLFVLFAATGCSSSKDPGSQDSGQNGTQVPGAAGKNTSSYQITFNGSSTLAPVISSIATAFNEKHVTWNNVNPSFPEENIAIYVSSGGSGQGMKAVIDQTADFGLLARTVKDSEREKVPNMKEYLVGIDALTIAVNPNNPFSRLKDNLTKEEIVKIFSGEYESWSDLDPSLPNKEIIVVIRDIGGGAHEVFQNNIMGDANVKATAVQSPSMGALVTKIMENDNAIGYASYGVSNQNAGSLAMFKVNGVAPNAENILNGSYIIQRPLLIISSSEPAAIQQSFLDVVLGEEGQEIVEKSGFIRAN